MEEALQHPVAAAGTYQLRLTILSCDTAPADVTGDCAVSVDDLVELILAWGEPGGPGDVNGDGTVDVDDLIAMILAWGEVENEYLLEVLARAG